MRKEMLSEMRRCGCKKQRSPSKRKPQGGKQRRLKRLRLLKLKRKSSRRQHPRHLDNPYRPPTSHYPPIYIHNYSAHPQNIAQLHHHHYPSLLPDHRNDHQYVNSSVKDREHPSPD